MVEDKDRSKQAAQGTGRMGFSEAHEEEGEREKERTREAGERVRQAEERERRK